MKNLTKEIDEIIKKIEERGFDWEMVHSDYDDALRLIAKETKPELLKKLDEATEKCPFWCA